MTVPTIQEKVAEAIANLGPQVESNVVDVMVDKELQKRTPVIVQGLEKIAEFKVELKKVDRPDVKTLNADGSVKDESYSPKKFEEVKKIKERIEKFTNATNKALTDGDLKELNQLLQQSGGKDKSEGKPGTTEETA
jgi:hypothetical protein